MDALYPLAFTLNGARVEHEVSVRTTLADLLRHQIGKTATHVGCEQGSCGACTVLVDGRMVRACLIFAIQIEGSEIKTSDGYGDDALMAALRTAFAERNALQCGFCTSGMLIAGHDLLSHVPHPDRQQIREKISGNFCRCTGYEAIVDAIWKAAQQTQAAGAGA